MNRSELVNQIKTKRTFLCVGLDTDLKKVPQHILKEEAKPRFLRGIRRKGTHGFRKDSKVPQGKLSQPLHRSRCQERRHRQHKCHVCPYIL